MARLLSFTCATLTAATEWRRFCCRASADWYRTITEGIAGGELSANTGFREPDALNLWPGELQRFLS
jgi:hypothetical protein|eukprot:SAG25_NODE_1621_length_2660_cov_0.979695_3_plen_67_part_00